MKTVPNQRIIKIKKEPTDKEHKYTTNNLTALNEALEQLDSQGGFKLYMYLAKNQNKYSFNLSSNDFMLWSGLGYTAYTTAFEELEEDALLKKYDEKNMDAWCSNSLRTVAHLMQSGSS